MAQKICSTRGPLSFRRLAELSFPEQFYAPVGSIGAGIFGSFNPLLAYKLYHLLDCIGVLWKECMRPEVNKWCLIIACMGTVTIVVNFLQNFYFGIMGETMTGRVRRMMFSAMLRNAVGWLDEEENRADALSVRLANDAAFVRAAFSNRLSILSRDAASVIVALSIGVLPG